MLTEGAKPDKGFGQDQCEAKCSAGEAIGRGVGYRFSCKKKRRPGIITCASVKRKALLSCERYKHIYAFEHICGICVHIYLRV